jgi:hypothetical protein
VRGSHSKRDDPAICEATARRAEFLPLRGIPCVFAVVPSAILGITTNPMQKVIPKHMEKQHDHAK